MRHSNNDDFWDAIGELGNGMMGCGCLLTIFVTVPIILIILFTLF